MSAEDAVAMKIRESKMNLPVHSSGAVNAWEGALTPAAEVDALERVLRRAVATATAAAIAD